jgi:hypothetical protein
VLLKEWNYHLPIWVRLWKEQRRGKDQKFDTDLVKFVMSVKIFK